METHFERPLDGAKSSEACRVRLHTIEGQFCGEAVVILQVAIGSACLTDSYKTLSDSRRA
jgi:hypothetical protein